MHSKSTLVLLGLIFFLAAGAGIFLMASDSDRSPDPTASLSAASGSEASGDAMPEPFAWAKDLEAPPDENAPDLSAAELPIDSSEWADAAAEEYRLVMLDRAFEIASKMQLDPHVKTRSRFQDLVVAEAIDLGQPTRAFLYSMGIENWRKGLGFARVALHLVEKDPEADVKPLLARAESIALQYQQDPNFQEWRRDRILVTAAQAYLLLGDEDRVARLEADVEPSEAGKVDRIRARSFDASALESHFAYLDEVAKLQNFDRLRNALVATVEAYDALFDDETSRDRIAQKIVESFTKVPRGVRIEILAEMSIVAADHDDSETARSMADRVAELVEGAKWLPEHGTAQMARVAELYARAGADDAAKAWAQRAAGLFDEKLEEIVDIFRTEALLPLAVAYHVLGDDELALGIYGRAIEQAIRNPNSRPRAEDLTLICLSIAEQGVEPDDVLLEILDTATASLGHPW